MAGKNIANDRIDSWKDIASYLGRDVRTVVRWEKQKGLPVHRVPGGQRQLVFAYKRELEAWLSGTPTGNSDQSAGDAEDKAPLEVRHSQTSAVKRLAFPWRIWCFTFVLGLLVISFAAVWLNTESSPQVMGIAQLTDNLTQKASLLVHDDRLYFGEQGEQTDGRFVLSSIALRGGPISHISTPFLNALPEDISRDGKSLLVLAFEGIESERSLWTLPVQGGTPQRVGTMYCHSATWSPDGSAIAYAAGDAIYVTQDRGESSKKVGQFQLIADELHWSPDGKELRFQLRDTRTSRVKPWKITFSEGLNPTLPAPLQLENDSNCCEAWTWDRDKKYFFYSASPAGSNARVSILQENGWWWKPRVRTENLYARLPEIAALAATDANSKKLLALVKSTRRSELFRFNPVTHEVTPYAAGVSGTYIDFSPDGRWISYVSLTDDTLWTSRTDGTSRKQLTFSPMQVNLPRWSPDGSQIVFTAKQLGRPWRVYVIPREGGVAWEASSGEDDQGAPTWAPDGKSLIYANVLCQENHTCAVHRIDLATRKVEQLPDSEGLRTARISPNGRYVAALQPERHELFLLDLRTQKWRKLLGSVTGDDISWSWDSRSVYTVCPVGENAEILRVAITGGKVESIVSLKSLNQLTSKIDGFAVAPDESIVMSRRFESSEIYALDWK